MPSVAVPIATVFELEGFVNDVVVGKVEELQHLSLVEKQLGTQFGLGVRLHILTINHKFIIIGES